ncbi:MAG TPA: PQQ-binding-like beta-propeller repeat protein, partial [Candidatus Binataceae bacterium]|nr:PQQ-binding-like beta-propeller repeat protein [Candidatus Binataceae bacterium]
KFTIKGASFTSPAIEDDGTIIAGTEGDCFTAGPLYAISTGGTQKWKVLPKSGIFFSPVIGGDGTIYISAGSKLFAISRKGTAKWKTVIGPTSLGSPAIGRDGTVYVGSLDHYLYAIGPTARQ